MPEWAENNLNFLILTYHVTLISKNALVSIPEVDKHCD